MLRVYGSQRFDVVPSSVYPYPFYLLMNKTRSLSYPRIVFSSIQAAHKASPYFIDEEQVGLWLSSANQALQALGTTFNTSRNAIHIPSLEQTGDLIPKSTIADICQRAASIGLTRTSNATGYWTLASTGALQKESVKIAFSDDLIDPDSIRNLARDIIVTMNQEAVAVEISGRVEQLFIS